MFVNFWTGVGTERTHHTFLIGDMWPLQKHDAFFCHLMGCSMAGESIFNDPQMDMLGISDCQVQFPQGISKKTRFE